MRAAEVISGMVQRIVAQAAPEKIVLFGSHAREEAGPESDLDLLVLFARLGDRRRMVSELYDAVSGCGLPKDIVVSTVEEFERLRNVVNTVHWSADQDGRLLYERQS